MTVAQARAAHAADEARRRAHLAGFLHREYARGECRSPFDGTIGTRREVANHDSFFSVGLPLNEPDPVARLRATHAATNERKLDRDAQYREHLLHELAGVPPLEHFVTRMERNPRRFALSVSNVPGPREPVSVLGASVAHLHSIAEIGERHALRVSATSLAGLLCFGLCADPHLVDELHMMAEGIEAEAQELFAAAGVA